MSPFPYIMILCGMTLLCAGVFELFQFIKERELKDALVQRPMTLTIRKTLPLSELFKHSGADDYEELSWKPDQTTVVVVGSEPYLSLVTFPDEVYRLQRFGKRMTIGVRN